MRVMAFLSAAPGDFHTSVIDKRTIRFFAGQFPSLIPVPKWSLGLGTTTFSATLSLIHSFFL
jgi:hypothetical protein